MPTLSLNKIILPSNLQNRQMPEFYSFNKSAQNKKATGILIGPVYSPNLLLADFVQLWEQEFLTLLRFVQFDKRMKKLRFSLSGQKQLSILSFQGLENLESLYFSKCGSEKMDLINLSSLKSLQTLEFEDCFQNGILHLTDLPPNLEELSFTVCGNTKPFHFSVSQVPSTLKILKFNKCATQSSLTITDARIFLPLQDLIIQSCGRSGIMSNPSSKSIFIIDEHHPLPAEKVLLVLDSLATGSFLTLARGIVKLRLASTQDKRLKKEIADKEQILKNRGWEIVLYE